MECIPRETYFLHKEFEASQKTSGKCHGGNEEGAAEEEKRIRAGVGITSATHQAPRLSQLRLHRVENGFNKALRRQSVLGNGSITKMTLRMSCQLLAERPLLRKQSEARFLPPKRRERLSVLESWRHHKDLLWCSTSWNKSHHLSMAKSTLKPVMRIPISVRNAKQDLYPPRLIVKLKETSHTGR